MDNRQLRRAQQRSVRGRRRLGFVTVGATCVVALVVLAAYRPGRTAPETPAPPVDHRVDRVQRPRTRPLQLVVVSFDGSGGVRLWPYWRGVARRAHAHFTFFVSGVYLLGARRRALYHPPRHPPGRSDIGFAQSPEIVRGTLEQIAAAYREGHEIGTHFNGHFCEPYRGSVGEWNAADWRRELDEFDKLMFHASANNHLRPQVRLPFGPSEIVGERTPCLQGRLPTLYRVLASRGFRYDASQIEPLGYWPRRELGIWNVPLLEIPFVGHTFRVVSMDYNLFANQTGGVSGTPSLSPTIERETYLSFRRAFRASYYGNRAPLSLGNHFETWNHWAYDRALAHFLLDTCSLPEVRCASFRELVDWLAAQPRRSLRRFRAGKFPRPPLYHR